MGLLVNCIRAIYSLLPTTHKNGDHRLSNWSAYTASSVSLSPRVLAAIATAGRLLSFPLPLVYASQREGAVFRLLLVLLFLHALRNGAFSPAGAPHRLAVGAAVAPPASGGRLREPLSLLRKREIAAAAATTQAAPAVFAADEPASAVWCDEHQPP